MSRSSEVAPVRVDDAQLSSGGVLVSVVIPCFNAQDSLGAAISSALRQNYRNVEVVVVDDGSTDRSRAVASAYGDRVTVVHQENAGVSAARNAGLTAARGQYIALCDADDQLLPHHVDQLMGLIMRSPPRSIATTDALVVSAEGPVKGRSLLVSGRVSPSRQQTEILKRNFVPPFCLFPRSLTDEIGGFELGRRLGEDWDLWIRAILHGWQFVFASEATAIYALTSGSASSDLDSLANAEAGLLLNVDRRYGHLLSPAGQIVLRRQVENGSAGFWRHKARVALDSGDRATASRNYMRVARAADGNWRALPLAALARTGFGAAFLARRLRGRQRRRI